jgi:hypothetical protein
LSGTGTVTIAAGTSKNFTATTLSTSLQFYGQNSLNCYGSLNLGANATYVTTPLDIYMVSATAGNTVTVSNASVCNSLNYNNGGTFSQAAATIPGGIYVSNSSQVTFTGAFNGNFIQVTNAGSLTTGAFTHNLNSGSSSSFYASSSTVNLTNSTINLGTTPSYSGTADFYLVSVTFTSTGSTINMGHSTLNNAISITGDGYTYNTVSLTGSAMTITGPGSGTGLATFANLTATSSDATYNNGSLFINCSITVTNSLTLQGASIAPDRLFVCPSQNYEYNYYPTPITITLSGAGAKTFKWADFQDITLSVTGATPTFTSVGDCLGNTGFTFTPAVTRYAVTKLTNVAITGTAGQFSCTSHPGLVAGQTITISGTYGGTGSISGYTNPTQYYVIGAPTATTFQLSATSGGAGITTTAGTPTGLTFTVDLTNFSSTGLWSATSGGATGQTVPLPQDTVIFDSYVNAVVAFDISIIGKDVTVNADSGYIPGVLFGISQINIYGTPNSGAINSFNAVGLQSRSSILVPSCSTGSLLLGGKGGVYTLSGNITLSVGLFPIYGDFYTSGYSITTAYFGGYSNLSGASSASIYASNSAITVSGDFQFNSGFTAVFTNSTIYMTSPAGCLFTAPNQSLLGTVVFQSSGSSKLSHTLSTNNSSILRLVNSGTSPKEFRFTSGSSTTIGTLEISGSSASPVLVAANSLSSSASVATISLTNSVVTSFVAFCNITKTGAGTISATGVANLGRNTGINFTSTLYGILWSGSTGASQSGLFTVPSNFSGSSMLVAVGGGGGGAKRNVTTGSAGGGGGGGISIASNLSISPGQVIYFSAGAGGTGGTTSTGQSGGNGVSSWANITSNVAPSLSSNGALANGGGGSSLSSTSGALGGSVLGAVGLITAGGGNGGNGGLSSSASYGGGAGGGAGRSTTTITNGYSGGSAGSSTSGGAGGGGYGGAGLAPVTTTGGAGGLNSLSAQASGGTAGNAGGAGTNGGGAGGGGGATTGTAGAGGAGGVSADYAYTTSQGIVTSGTIGPGGGAGGGGGASSTGSGGAGGDNSAVFAGGGGGGGGRGNTVATNGNGGNGSGGFVLFVYTLAPVTRNQGSIIG